MRSKIGLKSRLAAHILAMILLVFVLIYLDPSGTGKSVPHTGAPVSHQPDPVPAPVAKDWNSIVASAPESAAATTPLLSSRPATGPMGTLEDRNRLQPQTLPIRPVQSEDAQPPEGVIDDASPVIDSAGSALSDADIDADAGTSEKQPESISAGDEHMTVSDTEQKEAEDKESQSAPIEHESDAATGGDTNLSPVEGLSEGDSSTEDDSSNDNGTAESAEETLDEIDSVPQDEEPTPPVQPDESGALVVAGTDTADSQPATTHLPNANLEVLGDGVYWLGAQHDLEKELEAIPELAGLIILAPLPEYRLHAMDDIKAEVIPADPADINQDAIERFLYRTSASPRPVVVAALPGARGAAFFKGAYLLHNRNLSYDEVVREIEPELETADAAREEILHRLLRLKDR